MTRAVETNTQAVSPVFISYPLPFLSVSFVLELRILCPDSNSASGCNLKEKPPQGGYSLDGVILGIGSALGLAAI
jgi:hypothetical protein